MKSIKFLHCADIHLDAPFSSLGADKSKVRRNDIKNTFDRIIELCSAEKVDMLLISGDLYEHAYVSRATINYINDRFRWIPDTDVFVIPGNHDPYTLNSYYRNYEWSRNVHILAGDRTDLYVERLGTHVFGMGFESFSREQDIRPGALNVKADNINILLIHGTLDMNLGENTYNPVSSSFLSSLGMDYIALGHFHTTLQKAGQNIYNPGSPEPLGFDEEGDHGVFIGNIVLKDDLTRSISADFIKLNKKTYETADINADGCNSGEMIVRRIEETFKDRDISQRLLLINLKGYVDRELVVDTAQICAFFAQKCFFMKVKDETVPDYDFNAVTKEPGIRGMFAARMLDRIAAAEGDKERHMLRKALYYGMQALDEGKVNVR